VLLATNAVGVRRSAPASVVVRSPPLVILPPVALAVAQGQSAQLTVRARAFPAASYRWFKDGVPISGAAGAGRNLTIRGSASAEAFYSVVVSNALGSVSSEPVPVTVFTPVRLLRGPSALNLRVGQTRTLSVQAEGLPVPAYQWLKDGVELPGHTEADLVLTDAQLADAGRYRVRVTNDYSTRTSEEALVRVSLVPYEAVPKAGFILSGSYTDSDGDSDSVFERYGFGPGDALYYRNYKGNEAFTLRRTSFRRVSETQLRVSGTATIEGVVLNLRFTFNFTTPLEGSYVLEGRADAVGYSASQSGNFTYSEPGL
jgi:hypothetical protein